MSQVLIGQYLNNLADLKKLGDHRESEQIDPDAVTQDSPLQGATVQELAQKVFANKARRRRFLAALPVEEKYRRFLQLQRIVSEIKRAAGKPAPVPWPD